MNSKVSFIFGVHAHQPVGNFQYVVERAYESCYRPFLETLLRFPAVKSTWHISGPLLEFFKAQHPEYLLALRSLVDEGRLEFLASGYYEPVLASLTRVDRREQIVRYRDKLHAEMGVRPEGLWLTERVWEPEIIHDLVACGIRYVLVDDYHFLSAGFSPEQLHGYFLTESGGEILSVFPIDETLRYLTPFRPEDMALDYASALATGSRQPAAIIVDDLEKFGAWPGTADWVYRRGWLERFFQRFSESPGVEWTVPREYMTTAQPRGIAYLPTASYFEMGEWTLPAERARVFHQIMEEWKAKPEWERLRPFFRGSIWKNFFVKYPEANYLHKKMLHVSAQVNAIDDHDRRETARVPLYRAQCNDAYWHGVFGGLYLPHLRRAVYRNLLEAEALCDRGEPKISHTDLDADGAREVYLTNEDWVICVSPRKGGGVREFSSRSVRLNLADTLSRRYEHYHPQPPGSRPEPGAAKVDEAASSIHEVKKSLSAKIRGRITYDEYERLSFLDHFFRGEVAFEDFQAGRQQEAGDFVHGEYVVERLGEGRALLSRTAATSRELPSVVRKEYRWNVGPNRLEVHYEIVGSSPPGADLLFAPEMNLAFPAAESESGSVRSEGHVLGGFGGTFELHGAKMTLRDEVGGFELLLDAASAEKIWIFPVRTLSQSEEGFDEIYQGSSITPLFRLPEVSQSPFECTIALELRPITHPAKNY